MTATVTGALSTRRKIVDSSCLASIAYEADARILEVEFRKGTVYRYLGVPAAAYDALTQALSIGRFFASSIRNHFPYVRVSPST